MALALATPSMSQDDGQASVVAIRSTSGEYLGAGVVLTQDGYIVTTTIFTDEDAFVLFADRSERAARRIGGDRYTNLTVLKVDATALPAARIADMASVAVGEPVVCIGVRASRPGFDIAPGTVRQLEVGLRRAPFVPYIETSVGQCDGPLFNARGEVVGLNEVVRADAPERAFAIPIDVAVKVQRQLGAYGKVVHGRLGLVMAEVTAEIATEKRLGTAAGALVHSVEAGGPAERAGIKAGDILLDVDGKPVARSRNAVWLIAALAPGVPTELRVWRNGAFQTMTARAGAVVEPRKSQ
jgi:serine protease Do